MAKGNKNINNSVLEDEDEDVVYIDVENEEDADLIIEEVEESFEAELELETQEVALMSEAEKRIEQANLYQALLKHDLFAEDSARPEVIDAVKKEFKGFILSRLEILLGIKPEPQQIQQVQVELPFSDDEINALKSIASRLLVKSQTPTAPTPAPARPVPTVQSVQVNTVKSPAPAIKEVKAKPQAPVQQVRTQPAAAPVQQAPVQQTTGGTQKKVVRRVVRKVTNSSQNQTQTRQVVQPTQQIQKKETGNVSEITGQDYSQAVSPVKRPRPIPSQAMQDDMNMRQADANSRGSSPFSGGDTGIVSKILTRL